jgi:hypothetical protein
MKRLFCLAVVFASVLLVTTAASAASRPTITSLTGTFDLGNLNEGPTGPVCPFPVLAVFHAGPGAKQITFHGQGVGFAAFQTGHLTVTLTNGDTGETITRNISGPTRLNADGSGVPVRGQGPWLIFEPIAQGGLRFFHGNLSFEPVSYGVHAILNGGTEENLCDVLA